MAQSNGTRNGNGHGPIHRNGNGKLPRLDKIDLAIIRELQTCSKITNAALAERIGISAPSTTERVRKLESAGVICGYVALLNPAALNRAIMAMVHVTLSTHTAASLEKAKEMLGEFDEVMACWHTAGDDDFLLKVTVCDMEQYERFISEKLSTVPNIGKIKTAFVLSTIKHTTQIPIDCDGDVSESEEHNQRRGLTKRSI